jgi:competence protein ComFC
MNLSFSLFLDAIFPRFCLLCKKRGMSLCEPCAQTLPTGFEFAPQTFSLLSYQSKTVRVLIHRLKYRSDTSVFEGLKTLYIKESRKFLKEGGAVTLVPIPLRRSSKRKRRLDHVSYCAEGLAEAIGQKVETALYWERDLGSQVRARNKKERTAHMKNTLRAHPVSGIVLLIDDVSTTGATIAEGRRALKEAGAKVVYAYVLAH